MEKYILHSLRFSLLLKGLKKISDLIKLSMPECFSKVPSSKKNTEKFSDKRLHNFILWELAFPITFLASYCQITCNYNTIMMAPERNQKS